jgi:hypothetical protein
MRDAAVAQSLRAFGRIVAVRRARHRVKGVTVEWPIEDAPEDDGVDPDEPTKDRARDGSRVEPETLDRRYRCDAAAYTVRSQDGTVGRVDSIRSSWDKLRRRQPRELAILIDRAAAVRLWLDRNGSEPRVIVEDLERGDYVSLNAVELSDLILDRQEHQE